MDVKVEARVIRTFHFTLSEEDATEIDNAFGPGNSHHSTVHSYCYSALSGTAGNCPICRIVKAIRQARGTTR